MANSSDILRDRLRETLLDRGMSPRQLSLAIGANHSYISQILNGKGGMPASSRLTAIARELGVSADWLGGLVGNPEPVGSEVAIHDAPVDWTRPDRADPGIPLVGTGDCADLEVTGEDGETVLIERSSFDPDYHQRYLARPPALRGAVDLYAITFVGDSMSPRFEPGEIGIVDPRAHIAAGNDVVVQLRDGASEDVGGVLVKRLVRRTATEVVLQQFNPPQTFVISMRQVKRIHRIRPQTDLLF
nr:helix-turn-helix domain-containing protein [Aurantiacibacter luteus]